MTATTVTATTPATDADYVGEQLDVHERVIVAPAVGVFHPLPPEVVTAEGEVVAEGQLIGHLDVMGNEHPVRSPFTGFLMGMLANAGDRVRAGQPVAWLRTLGTATA
jgi:biotin carboxyl carrier protein